MQHKPLLFLSAAVFSAHAIAARAAEPFQPTPNTAIVVLHCGHFFDAGVRQARSAKRPSSPTASASRRSKPAGPMFAGAHNDRARHRDLPARPYRRHTHLTSQTSPTGYTDQFRWNLADYAIRSTVYARRTLDAGFTTVRNLGDGANASIALRNAINAGIVPGPRIFTAGSAIGSTGGHADDTDGYRNDLPAIPVAKQRHHQRSRRRVEGRAPALQGRR